MKKEYDLFTVILTNYNQELYIFDAIDSIINQTYKNIELIVADDCSNIFNEAEILNYIKNKSSNINDIKFVVNLYNIGTVKTMNKCLKLSKGKYVTIFAADDELHNKNVILNYYNSFCKNKDINIISSVCELYDKKMNIKIKDFPNKSEIINFNKKDSFLQFAFLSKEPFFAPGATAYTTKLVKLLNYFDEKYFLIEDWPWFLRCTRKGYNVKVESFVSLKHRGGGISESNQLQKRINKVIIKDTNNIYKKEIFPFMRLMDINTKILIMRRYQIFIYAYKSFNKTIFFEYWLQHLKHFDLFYLKLKDKQRFFENLIIAILSFVIAYIINKYIIKIYGIICFICPIVFILLLYFKKVLEKKFKKENGD